MPVLEDLIRSLQIPERIKNYSSELKSSIRSPQGEYFPKAIYKRPKQEQYGAYADLFSSAVVGATSGPVATSLKSVPLKINKSGYKRADVGKLSKVPKGKTRLYKAERGRLGHEDFWDKGQYPRIKGFQKGDQFFTDNIKIAEYFRSNYKGVINYVDVLTKTLRKVPGRPGEFLVNMGSSIR